MASNRYFSTKLSILPQSGNGNPTDAPPALKGFLDALKALGKIILFQHFLRNRQAKSFFPPLQKRWGNQTFPSALNRRRETICPALLQKSSRRNVFPSAFIVKKKHFSHASTETCREKVLSRFPGALNHGKNTFPNVSAKMVRKTTTTF